MNNNTIREYSTCCLLLTLPHEIDVTIQTLDSLLFGNHHELCVLILINGGSSQKLLDITRHLSNVVVYESEINLGVAGGRAFLAAQQKAREADIIALLDNDLILPVDYLNPLCELIVHDGSIGIVGASVLSYRHLSHHIHTTSAHEPGPLGCNLPRFTNLDLRHHIELNNSEEQFFHIGIDTDWERAYFSPSLLRDCLGRYIPSIKPKVMLSQAPEMRALYKKNGTTKIEVSNIAGCTQLFRRSIYEELGGFRTEYSPYGFEDVDFCIRALRAGYRNYTLTNAFSLHGTDDRHERRQTIPSLWGSTVCTVRSYTFLTHNHYPGIKWILLLRKLITRSVHDIFGILSSLFVNSLRTLIVFAASISGCILALSTTSKLAGRTRIQGSADTRTNSSQD